MTFSVKTLLVFISAVGVALYLLVSAPSYVAVPSLVLLHVALFGVLLTGTIYGAGKLRAFSIGAIVPAGATVIALTFLLSVWLLTGPLETENWQKLLGYVDRHAFTHRVWSAAAWIICPLVGLSTLAARRLILARRAGDASGAPRHPPAQADP